MQTNQQSDGLLHVSRQEIYELFKTGENKDLLSLAALFLISLILTPITIFGAFLGYKRGYNVFMQEEEPRLHRLRTIVKISMVLGAVIMWVLVYIATKLMTKAILWLVGDSYRHSPIFLGLFLLMNVVISILLFISFNKWRKKINQVIQEKRRHGTARFAYKEELDPYRTYNGIFMGQGLYYNRPGHFLTVAGTRGGKLANLLSYNLLLPSLFKGNMVVLDPKGELASISERIQRQAGRKTVVINPWKMLLLKNAQYNPLELLGDSDSPNIVDDVQMIVECIVPFEKNNKDSHWDDKARTILTGLILHLVTENNPADRTFEKVWEWLRLPNEEWFKLLSEMSTNDNPNVGEIVRATANEVINLFKNSEREYGSVMSTTQKHTDFIKSPALRHSMSSSEGFNLENLESRNVTIYVVIPFDRIATQSKWLRLVITSLMRYTMRNTYKTAFILDEAYALGFHSEILTAIGAYAGLGIHVWSIFQNLGQIKDLYGENWEGFMANCSVRHFFNITDNTSTEYISKMCGQISVPEFDDKGDIKGSSARDLITADELRRESGDTMYALIDQLPPAPLKKIPYYTTDIPCDDNPYQNDLNKDVRTQNERFTELMRSLEKIDQRENPKEE